MKKVCKKCGCITVETLSDNFNVYNKNEQYLGTITPANNSDFNSLNGGGCPICDGWEDGNGNTCNENGWDVTSSVIIHSGEGETGVFEHYKGLMTYDAIQERLESERYDGRWARAWVYSHSDVYYDIDEPGDQRNIPDNIIREG